MTTRSRARVYRGPRRPLAEGACPSCFRVVSVLASGHRRRHRDNDGRDCPGSHVLVGEPVVGVDVYNVNIVIPTDRPGNTLPATGRCHECDRVVTGERRYCGPCMAARL